MTVPGYEGPVWEAEELADCYLILLHISHKLKVDLHEQSRAKFFANQQRQWKPRDADGVSEHIK